MSFFGKPVSTFPGHAMVLAALLAAGPTSIRAQEAKPGANAQSTPAQIDRNGVLILIRNTLLALDHANKTGNYTVLRDLGAPGFQSNTDARLAEIFAAERKDNLDLSGVAALEPQLTILPQIEPNGLMHMAGFFPSVPNQVNFELLYAPVNRQWRLFGVSVSVGQTGPVAPAPPSPPATPPRSAQLKGEAHPPPAPKAPPPAKP